MYEVKQSTALTLPFFVHDVSGDAVLSLTDGSFTKRISKNGAAFGAMTVTITELENGWYSIPLSTSHSDTLGILTIVFTNAGAKQVNLQFRVEAKLIDDLNDVAATDIVSGGAIDTTGGAVDNVTLVATTTANSDMRGTDNVPVASVTGTSDSGGLNTMVDAARTEIDTHWVGSYIRFGAGGSANNIGVTRMIDTFTAATDTIRFNPDVLTAITTETYEILPAANIDDILADTNELQADWTNAGRLDVILDIIAADVVNIDGQAMRGTNSALLAADINLTAGVLDEVATLTNHTAQTGDSFARLGAPVGASISVDLQDVPTVSEFNARTLLAAAYFDPATDTVALVTLVTTTTTNSDMRGTDSAALASVCTEARISELDAGTGGKMANQVDIIQIDTTTDIPALIAALNDLSAAQVNAEVLDVMNVDTIALPGQVAPPLTPTHRQALAHLYKMYRNKGEQTATEKRILADDELIVDQKWPVSDNGTTFTKGEVVTGP